MIKIYYSPETNFFSFMSHEDRVGHLDLDEATQIAATAFSMFAANMEGSNKEAYIEGVDTMIKAGKDPKIISALDEMYEINEDHIFLNGETVEESINLLAKEVKNAINSAPKQLISNEDKEEIVKGFCADMLEVFGIDPSETFKPVNLEPEEYEDDLF